jgi:hypothetical protein
MIDAFRTNGSSPRDFGLSGRGTLYLLPVLTFAARAWVQEPVDATWFANAIMVERRYISAIVPGAIGDGLRLRVQ